jgi:N-acetylglutamate synthase-like GNAT family acetyltransferase
MTMGCCDDCPAAPGARRDDWPLPDPRGKSMEEVRVIRDEIRGRVIDLIDQENWRASGEAALLRSVVVASELRGTGLGGRLTDAAMAFARNSGATSVSLLTTTAAPFFAARGFRAVRWDELPAALGASSELTGACPTSATAMHRDLDE